MKKIMKHSSLIVSLVLSFVPLALGTQYLVEVGKDETTGHYYAESSFDNPCVSSGGVGSGAKTVPNTTRLDAPGLPTYTYTVTSNTSMWFFDDAGGLCHKGAIFAVNPTSSQTAPAFVENAKQPSRPASSTTSVPTASNSASQSAETAVTTSPSTHKASSHAVHDQPNGLAVVLFAILLFIIYGLEQV
ncbi:hypothetical protein H0H93_001676 [Arthromyces matolae]|nr:hypothetical protein H0H93_001676 [Arthromyces matolae]